MPVFDYKCKCGLAKLNKLVKKYNDKVKCDCGKDMVKQVCSPSINGMDSLGRSR